MDPTGTTHSESELLFTGTMAPGWLLVLAVAAVGILVLTWLDLRGMRGSRTATILALRAIVLGTLLVLLLEPAVELRDVRRVPNHVAVVVDQSESHGLEVGGRSGVERAADHVARMAPRIAAHDDHRLESFAFAAELQRVPAEVLSDGSLTADGDRTDILAALDGLTERFDRRDIGGVLLYSDGIDNGELGERTPRGEPLDASHRGRLEALGFPVHTMLTVPPEEVRDVAIERIRHEDFAFVRNAVSVEVDLRVLGYTSGTLPVSLHREGELLQTRVVTLSPDETRHTVRFEFVPELIGKELYTVEVPVLDGELVARNNRDAFVLRIIRDRIRVLHVVGRPGWDQRFLRELLTGNPNVDMVSFYILRSQSDVARAAQSELSLIAFPTDELFNEQLGSFDLVIFQNFTHVPYHMRQYLPNVARYVEGGGGFLMIGGEQSFASGGFAGTEVERILPVRLPSGGTLIDRAAFRPALTDAGQRHPITRVEFDARRNEETWDTLPELTGTNVVRGPAPGAVVLAHHPSRRGDGGMMPVVAVSDVGEGRSMAVTADSTWRWTFQQLGGGGSARPYNTFWGNAMRWLIRDPELNLLQVGIQQTAVRPGEEVRARVRVFRPDYAPAEEVTGRWEARFRDLSALGEEGELRDEGTFETDDRGVAEVLFVPDAPGAWTLRATVPQEDGETLVEEEIVLVRLDDREVRDLAPRRDLLEAIAEATGGTFTALPAGRDALPPLQPARVVDVDRRTFVMLWNHPFVLLALLLLLGVEWSLRRRWGRL
ncbi:MAG: hypothetical protein EA398_10285 [Deltaproteobacteria bacterium]|nr:MAG: hypothetical protein EA398_10285 [Deltaproteobacteria bacterium]